MFYHLGPVAKLGRTVLTSILLWLLTLFVPYGAFQYWRLRKYFPVRGRSKESNLLMALCILLAVAFRHAALLSHYPGPSCSVAFLVDGLACTLTAASPLLGAWQMYLRYSLTAEFAAKSGTRNSAVQSEVWRIRCHRTVTLSRGSLRTTRNWT
eukprot:g62333.t1